MKFGKKLSENVVPGWEKEYISYKELKKTIRKHDISLFQTQIRQNVKSISEFFDNEFAKAHGRWNFLQESPDLANNDDDLLAALTELSIRMRNLFWYAEINRRGVFKILKKADKKMNIHIQAPMIEKEFNDKPFFQPDELSSDLQSITLLLNARGKLSIPSNTHSSDYVSFGLRIDDAEALNIAIIDDAAVTVKYILEKYPSDSVFKIVLFSCMFKYSLRSLITVLENQESKDFLVDSLNQRNVLHKFINYISKRNEGSSNKALETLNIFLANLNLSNQKLLTQTDAYGKLPLHYSIENGLVLFTQSLVQWIVKWKEWSSTGLDTLWKDNFNQTPLDCAVRQGNLSIISTLINAGTDPLGSAVRSGNSLVIAASCHKPEIIELLLQANYDINSINSERENALHIASKSNDIESVRILIKGSDIQKIDLEASEITFGWTPLFYAAVEGNTEIVNMLVEAGSDIEKVDLSGWYAYEHAIFRGHINCGKQITPSSPIDGNSVSGSSSPSTSTPNSLNRLRSFENLAGNHFRSQGHTYLQKRAMVVLTLGSQDIRKAGKAISINNNDYETSVTDGTYLHVHAKNADGQSSKIELPVSDNTHPIVFVCSEPSKVEIYFDIFSGHQMAKEKKIIGRAVALLGSVKQSLTIFKASLQNSITVPIINKELSVIGSVTFEFQLIMPFEHPNMHGEAPVFLKSVLNEPRLIGHRGMGKNHPSRKSLQLGENTLESFIYAANLGASYVEFDVQVTKDFVPVIYHDFLVGETGIDVPIHNLTLEQFLATKSLHFSDDIKLSAKSSPETSTINLANLDKISTIVEKESIGPKGRPYRSLSVNSAVENKSFRPIQTNTRDFKRGNVKGNERGRTVEAPFTTLMAAFKKVPKFVGFNIECKYPMLDESEAEDMDTIAIELNKWVDAVLTVIFDNIEERQVIISSFSPDICLAIAMKQPTIPVLFLTESGTARMCDLRATSLQEAIRFASQWELLGIVTACEPLILCPRLIQVVKESGLICMSYGEMNNDIPSVKLQVKNGVDAVIVDSVLAIRKELTKMLE